MKTEKLELGDVSVEELWQLLDVCTDGVFRWDSASDRVEWSSGLMNALGYPEGRAAAGYDDVQGVIHPEDRQRHDEMVQRSIARREKYTIEIRFLHSDGYYLWFRVVGFWPPCAAGTADRLLGYVQNVDLTVRMHEQLRVSEARFKAFVDNCPAAVYIKDSTHRHLYGNAVAAEFAGCSLEQFLASSTSELFDEATGEALARVDRAVLEHGETVRWTGEIVAATGKPRQIVDTKFPVVDPETGDSMVGGFGVDVTREAHMDRALAQSQKLEAVGQLATGIAHDFNNTLAVLLGNLELMEMENPRPEVAAYMKDMFAALDRGSTLTRQLLSYGRRALLRPESADLNAVIAEMESLIRRSVSERVTVSVVPQTDLWIVGIDPPQVQTALLNLVLNARDAMPEGGALTVETANVQIDGGYVAEHGEDLVPGRYVMVAITDTGAGMPPEVLERAIEPFFSTKARGQGTGMGLPMVYGLMKQSEGTVRLYSEPGVGTTVKLLFPVLEDGPPEAAPDLSRTRLVEGTEHVLLVEDNDQVRAALRGQIGSLGYRVSDVASGEAALSRLREDPSIDAIVTDVVVPGIVQGRELARQVREKEPGFPILFVSGYPAGASLGGEDFLPDDVRLMKPVSLRELAGALRAIIDGR